jgi:hypothetical protein
VLIKKMHMAPIRFAHGSRIGFGETLVPFSQKA